LSLRINFGNLISAQMETATVAVAMAAVEGIKF